MRKLSEIANDLARSCECLSRLPRGGNVRIRQFHFANSDPFQVALCFFAAQPAARSPLEMDLFAFVDIIGIRAIGFPVVLTFRSYYLPARKTLLFPKGKINNSGTLASPVCAYARKRAFSASADSIESSCREFGNRACHRLRVDPLRQPVKKNGLIIRWIIYLLGSFTTRNAAR